MSALSSDGQGDKAAGKRATCLERLNEGVEIGDGEADVVTAGKKLRISDEGSRWCLSGLPPAA
ncbi:hypothetical protein HPP92_016796 [Vanilla planifolia]|uniref:Uncharacterized protein n=1 Tax=Vanilla planifolia TaxID=51239 RepID=A0A835QFG5_VANPL|nr:hypothetical protein HPP92_016796 [Vanilla planifolia]